MVNTFLDTVSGWVKIQKLDEKLTKLIQRVQENEEASRRGCIELNEIYKQLIWRLVITQKLRNACRNDQYVLIFGVTATIE